MNKSFVDLFEEQVGKTPDNIAVVFEHEQLSYRGLNERANMLAQYLRNQGVKEETLVPLYLERGIDMIVGMLGIMKAGGAYVPIDTDFPEERISYMLKDTGAMLVVGSKKSSAVLKAITGVSIIEVESIKDQDKDNLTTKVLPNHLAYVIYTSGSTGTPKGVMIEHRNLVDYISGLTDKTQINECKSFALVSTIATDLGNTVIYGSLASGGSLHLFTKESVSDTEFLHQYFAKNKLDCLKIVPSHWKVLNIEDKLLLPEKLLIFGGEALQERVIESIRRTGTNCRIVNHYGPTETTIGKLLHIVDADARYEYTVPIGKPFSNTKVLVLNKNLKLCPKGVPGELYITGDGVARGYLNNPELTKEKFIQNPFSKGDYSIMYSTGDLVKYLPDGNIEFIGRVDNQVKIRGYRIELGEIESHLQKSGLVNNAVVIASEDKNDNKRLVAYIVPQGGFDREGIFSYLKEKLPEYMLPAIIMKLDSLPLTPNGKVDRKALPEPEAMEAGDKYVAPRNEVEEKLVMIWEDVLEVDKIGINDDFFELGGHSLLAIRLISLIRKELQTEVKIGDVFDYPTIGLLSEHLNIQEAGNLLPAIELTPRPDRIPLSFSQERLLFIDQLEGSIPYHIPSVFRLKGDLNQEALNFSLQHITNRHEVLRTVFKEEEGIAFQHIKPIEPVTLELIDGLEYKANPQRLATRISALIKIPFDLSKDNMLRVSLIKLDTQEHVMVCTMHHIASDAWSSSILVKEIVELYNSYLENRTAKLNGIELQYADYSLWQRNHLQGEILEKKIAYWKSKLIGLSALELPTDFPRPIIQNNRGASLPFGIDNDTAVELQSLSRQSGTTLFITLLSVLNVLLSRYSGQEDICVGTPVAGRQQPEVEGLIGFFINTLALRNEVKGNKSFTELLQEVRATTMEAYSHQDVPFEKVVEAVVKERDLSRTPLFQVMLVFQNTPEVPQFNLGGLNLSREGLEHTTTKFDLSFILSETANGLQGSVQYNTSLYKATTIERMIGHYKELLQSIVAMPEEEVSKLKLLTQTEKNQLIKTFNDTEVEYCRDTTVSGLIEQQAQKTPGNIALVFEEEQISYKELNERSNQLASYLRKQGVNAEALVPVCVERGIEMVISILGILKAGGAYVPIDPEYPQDRISYMLEDTGAGIIITNKASRVKLGNTRAAIIEIDTEAEQIKEESKDDLKINIAANSLAYIIYTSGSTGKPKGVMIEHSSLLNYLLNSKTRYINEGKEEGSGSYVHLSYTFDASVTGMFMPLLWGRPVVIASNKTMNAFEDRNLQKYAPYDFIKITPSHLELIVALETEEKQDWLTDKLVIGGEAIHVSHFNYFVEKGIDIEIINEYGPTEATVGCSTYRFRTGDDLEPLRKGIPVGRPIDNTRMYITGPGGELLPAGVWGEITIGGEGIARGYLKREELTREKFIADPYSKKEGNRKLYKTGDIGRWQIDGTIEYQGRKDDQVKIRGYRIELGEIENVILQSGKIRQAVVLAKTNKANIRRLIGYIVIENGSDKGQLLEYLNGKLPAYMIPATWLEMKEMPLTSNGKIDRKALPDPEISDLTNNDFIAPRFEIEEKLAEIWSGLLGIDKIGINDNFFELGGDSILTIQVVSRARRFGYGLQPKDIFIYQTINKLCTAIQERSQAAVLGEQQILTGESGLLPIQQWYLNSEPPEISHFNQKIFLGISKSVTGEQLNTTIEQIGLHHDALRFRYYKQDGKWIQEYGGKNIRLFFENIVTTDPEKQNLIITELSDKYQRSLSIENGEIIKAVLFQTPPFEKDNRLLIVIHHLAVDGVSWRILLEDIEQILSGDQNLGNKSSSYREWYNSLEKYGRDETILSQKRYWKDILKARSALLTNKEYNDVIKVKNNAQHTKNLNADLTRQLLQDVPRVYHTEINDILLSALAVTIGDWSNVDNVIIGLEGHGREEMSENIDISRTVGWFTTLYPVLLKIGARRSGTGDLIKSVKEQLRQIPGKGIGYGILKYINKEEALQGEEPWEIVFNYLGQADNVVRESKFFSGAKESAGASVSEELPVKEKLSLNSIIRGGELIVTWTYSTKHFTKETIERLAGNYISHLKEIISYCLEQQKNGAVYTPSDYGLGAEISYEELDEFLNERF